MAPCSIKPRFRSRRKYGHTSAPQICSCHSERSEAESKNLSSIAWCRQCLKYSDASTSLRMTVLIGWIGESSRGRSETHQIKPRLRKSPRLPPEERSTRSIVNLSKQTSHASSTPWMIALSGSFLFSTCRLVRLITVSIESLSVCSFRSVLRN